MKAVNALMEGQRIELEDRRNCTFSRLLQAKKEENSDSDDSCCGGYVSEVSHNYSFRFARPRLSNERAQNKVAIKQLELPILNPEKAKTKRTTTLKRRPNKLGLKPIRLLSHRANAERSRQCIDEGPHDDEQREEDEDVDECDRKPAVNYDINSVDFDFDVLRLIMDAECSNNTAGEQDATGARGRVTTSVGKRKKIRFTLSKPQSPRTVQVIRVDVTASACGGRQDGRRSRAADGDAGDEDEDDYCGRFRRDYGLERQCANRRCKLGGAQKDLDFVVLCKKLTLSPKA